MRRLKVCVTAFGLLVGAVFFPSEASAQQSVTVYMGGFVPRGEESRTQGDVLFNDLGFFTFNPDEFRGFTFGGDWLAALNDRVEVGLGIGYYSGEAPSFYTDFINDLTGANIEQNLKLRISPINATFRVVPFGRNQTFQPYFGAGVGILPWRYSETGEFVDFDGAIFHDSFSESGTAVGPMFLGGIRVGLGKFDVGFEARHQSGSGELDPLDFAGGRKIDLGGMNYLATFNIRF
jgi:hypothetical protein